MQSNSRIEKQIAAYYEGRRSERDRLRENSGWLEFERTRELIRRRLPADQLRILDVGGAAGIHAEWLSMDGHNVQLVDPLPLHVEQAREAAIHLDNPFSCSLGDARSLDEDDGSVDVVLLLGPLYHLTERDDRVLAFAEARRVLKPGGLCFAAAITRFATLFSGLAWGLLAEPGFPEIVERALREGQHRNPTDHPGWFTTAYFHHPDELEAEAREAGFQSNDLYGIEGMPGWITAASDRWDDPQYRKLLLESARATESDPSLRGLSSHMLLVARKPAS